MEPNENPNPTQNPSPVQGEAKPTASAPTQTAPVPPALVNLPADEVGRLYTAERTLRELQAKNEELVQAERQKALKALSDKEGVEKALQAAQAQAQQEIESYRQTILGDKLAVTLADALAGVEFLSEHAREHARIILASRTEAAFDPTDPRRVIVRDKATGRPAKDAIRDALASEEFAHALKAKAKGGTGGGNITVANSSAEADEPKNLGDQMILEALERQKALAGTFGPAVGLGRSRFGMG